MAEDAIRRAQPANEPLTLPCAVGTALFGVTMDKKHIIPFIADEFIRSNNHWFVMGQHGEGEFDWVDCYTDKVAAEQALAYRRKPEGSKKCTEKSER